MSNRKLIPFDATVSLFTLDQPTTEDDCKGCRHHWSNFHPDDKEDGQWCYMFREFSSECVLWKGKPPLIQNAKSPLVPFLLLGIGDKE